MISHPFTKKIFLLLLSLCFIGILIFFSDISSFLLNPAFYLVNTQSCLKPTLPTQRLLQFTGNFDGGNNFMNNNYATGDLVYTGPVTSGQTQNFESDRNDDVYTGPYSSGLNEANNFGQNDDVYTGPVTSGNGGSIDNILSGLNNVLGNNDFNQINNNFSATSGK